MTMPTGKKIEKQKTSEIKCHWCGGILSCTQCGADLFYPDSPKSTGKKIEMSRVWAMPSHKTFSIKPIKELIARTLGDDFVDPFPFPFDKDALEYLKTFSDNSVDKLAFDPPYSPRQLKEMYGGAGLAYDTKNSYWSELKNEIARIVKPDGVVVSFGWNSMGIGKNRGFIIEEILLVPHGGNHNDTIVTVERKLLCLQERR